MSETKTRTTAALICKWYWNPLMLYLGMFGYFGFALSEMRFGVLLPLCLLFALWAMVAWVIAIAQFVMAVIHSRRNESQAVHGYISSLLVAGGYVLSYMLASSGVIVTV